MAVFSWSSCQRILKEDLKMKCASEKILACLFTENKNSKGLNVCLYLSEQVQSESFFLQLQLNFFFLPQVIYCTPLRKNKYEQQIKQMYPVNITSIAIKKLCQIENILKKYCRIHLGYENEDNTQVQTQRSPNEK